MRELQLKIGNSQYNTEQWHVGQAHYSPCMVYTVGNGDHRHPGESYSQSPKTDLPHTRTVHKYSKPDPE